MLGEIYICLWPGSRLLLLVVTQRFRGLPLLSVCLAEGGREGGRKEGFG